MLVRVTSVIYIILLLVIHSFAQSLPSENFEAEMAKGKELFNSGKFDEAKVIFTTLLQQHPKTAAVHYYSARCFFALRQYESAQEHIEKAIALCDTCADYHFIYGNLLFALASQGSKLKIPWRVNKGRSEMERAIALNPNHLPARYALIQFNLQAPGVMGGDKQKARQLAEEMDRINADHYLSFAAKMQLLLSENQIEKAKLLLDDRTDAFQKQEEKRQLGYFYNALGYSYLKDKKCEQAKSCFNRYILLAPDDPNAHDSLAEAYYVCGDVDTAIQEYEKALSIDPNFENSRKMLQKIKKEAARK